MRADSDSGDDHKRPNDQREQQQLEYGKETRIKFDGLATVRDEPRATWDFYLTNPGGCCTSSKTKWDVPGVVGGWERERVMNPIRVVLEIQGRHFFKHNPAPLAFRIKNNNNCFCYGMRQSMHMYLYLYVPCSWEKLPGFKSRLTLRKLPISSLSQFTHLPIAN